MHNSTLLKNAIAHLTVWKKNGQRAPHKPLLLLYVLSAYQKGHERLFNYGEEVHSPLLSLLNDVGPQRHTHYPEMPFWRLQNEGFWEVQNAEFYTPQKGRKGPSSKELITHHATGGFDKETYQLLCDEKDLIAQLAQQILSEYFSESERQILADRLELDLNDHSITRDPKPHQTLNSLWTREQLLVAFTLYSQLPFGQMHSKNTTIQHYADLIGRTPSALAMKLVNIASLDPFITNSGRTGLTGASKADRHLWEEMNQDPDKFERECQSVMAMFEPPTPERKEEKLVDFTGQEKIRPVKTRIGQQLFRKRVLEAYDNRCCITGLEDPILLIASHIRPWTKDASYRLDPRNGLCLSNLHDRAFDQGLITLNENLELVLSVHLKNLKSVSVQDNFLKYEGVRIRHADQFSPSQEHLAFHREHIFIDNL